MEVHFLHLMCDIETLIKTAGTTVVALRAAAKKLPLGVGYGHVWFNPETKQVWVSVGDWEEDTDGWRKPLLAVAGVKDVRVEGEQSPPEDEPWILIKKGHSPTLRALAQLTNFLPGPTNAPIGGPSPLAATLAGGILGAGTGYGAGFLGEQALPDEQFRPGRLRKTMALLGGLAGAAPGALWALESMQHHPSGGGLKSLLSGWPFRRSDLKGPAASNDVSPAPVPPEMAFQPGIDVVPPGPHTGLKLACAAAQELLGEPAEFFKTALDNEYGALNVDQVPLIDADRFNSAVWQDQRTPVAMRTATSGLVGGAQALRGGVNWVSPADVARIAVGMGSGYASGMLVGKALGALAGLRPEAQQSLQSAGTWAGFISNVVPLAFGGR